MQEHAERPCQAQHSATEQVRVDADHPAARASGHGCECGRDLPHLQRHGKDTLLHPLHRPAGRQNRPTGQQDRHLHVLAARASLRGRLHQSGRFLPETQVAVEVRIRYQRGAFPEARVPAIRVLRQKTTVYRHEGRNRGQVRTAFLPHSQQKEKQPPTEDGCFSFFISVGQTGHKA